MWHFLKVYLFLPPLLLALDYIWLGVFASSLYKKGLGPLLRMSGNSMQPIVWAAVMVYIAIPLGIMLFVLPRISPDHIIRSAIIWGALYGVIVYAIYEMTNYCLLKDWPLRIVLIDICWGALLNAIGALAAAFLDRWLR